MLPRTIESSLAAIPINRESYQLVRDFVKRDSRFVELPPHLKELVVEAAGRVLGARSRDDLIMMAASLGHLSPNYHFAVGRGDQQEDLMKATAARLLEASFVMGALMPREKAIELLEQSPVRDALGLVADTVDNLGPVRLFS